MQLAKEKLKSSISSIMHGVSSPDIEAFSLFAKECVCRRQHLFNSNEDDVLQSMSWQVEMFSDRLRPGIDYITLMLAKPDPQLISCLSKINKISALFAKDLVCAARRIAIQHTIDLVGPPIDYMTCCTLGKGAQNTKLPTFGESPFQCLSP